MEFQLQTPSLPILLTFLSLLTLLIKIRNKSKTRNPNRRLPPGPWKLPIIGSMHHLVGAATHRLLGDMANKYGPVMHLKLGQTDLVVISSPEAARDVTKTHDLNFASRPELTGARIVCYGGTDIAFSPYGDYWRQLRKICSLELLSIKRVRSFTSQREEEMSSFVREILKANGSPINITQMLMSLANTIISRATAFRDNSIQKQRFISALEEAIRLTSGFQLVDLFPSLKFIDTIMGVERGLERSHQQLDAIFDEIIREHQVMRGRKSTTDTVVGKEDLVDVLLRIKHSEDPNILTNDSIKGVILDMFAGGTETTSGIVEWAMSELIKNPKVMSKAQFEIRRVLKGKVKIEESDINEMHYLKHIIKETLRLHPPLPLLLPRLCSETCEVEGFTVLKGSRVVINVWAIGRDPKSWEEAARFKPERFHGSTVDFKGADFEYLPFGGGRRICPGINFGLATVEFILAHLLYCFDWKLPNGAREEDLDMSETFGITVRRKNDLHLVAFPQEGNHFVLSSYSPGFD